jgi:excisionase family DNA binding protein
MQSNGISPAPPQKRFLSGYDEAAEFTGLHRRKIEKLVTARQIRAVKPNTRTILFYVGHLLEDLLAMEAAKIS